jgi:outer membrane lipoprotein SlyB
MRGGTPYIKLSFGKVLNLTNFTVDSVTLVRSREDEGFSVGAGLAGGVVGGLNGAIIGGLLLRDKGEYLLDIAFRDGKQCRASVDKATCEAIFEGFA